MSGFELVYPGGRRLRQADLEAMEDERLREVRDEALRQFNSDIDGEHAEYFEILGGAASDLLFDRNREDVAARTHQAEGDDP